MSVDPFRERLSELVDGLVDETERAEIEAHLEACSDCRQIADDLRGIKDLASRLERREPSGAVWERLQMALGSGRRDAGPDEQGADLRHSIPRRAAPRWLSLAASLALLIAGGGALWWWSSGARESPRAGDPEIGYVLAELDAAEKHYQNAISRLETIVSEEGSELGPEVALVLDDNLTLLDRAIAESRSAMRTQPESDVARDTLLEGLRRKLSLLQNTVLLINEVRKGRGESALDLIEKMREPGDSKS